MHLVESNYKKTGKGITFSDLMKFEVVSHKKQGQSLLKYALKRKILFTLQMCRPQIYYPISLKSEIINDQMKNIPKQVTGVYPDASDVNLIINQSLINYVLPFMTGAPLYIHKLQLKTKISPQCYADLPASYDRRNKSKEYIENTGSGRITYLFYPNGTVMISIECSNNPLKLETEYDRSHILTFFGQIRDRLIMILSDPHERLVAKILEWELIQCDINKDIPVNHWLQATALKIQVWHLDHLFRVYIKSMGKDTVWRVEESKNPKKPVIESLNELFNPNEKLEKFIERQFQEYTRKILNAIAQNHVLGNSDKFDARYQ